jgi:hypothetical protein
MPIEIVPADRASDTPSMQIAVNNTRVNDIA